jgi:hypothetical protein
MKKLCIALLALAIIGIGVLVYYSDRILGGAIETAGGQALGVPVRVGLVIFRPLAGQFGLDGLTVDNPPGYTTSHFMQLGQGRVEVGFAGLRQQPIAIDRVELAQIDVNLERAGGKTNYGEILERQQGASQPEGGAQKDSASQESPVVVRELLIRDVRAHVKLAPGGQLSAVDVDIPELRLENLGAKEGGIRREELIQIATNAILEAVARKSGALPGELAADLLGGLRKVPVAGDVARQLGAGAERLGEGAKGAGSRIGDAVRDLLGGGEQPR